MLRAIDKLGKIGPEGVAKELREATAASAEKVAAILEMTSFSGTVAEVLRKLELLAGDEELAVRGLEELRAVVSGAAAGAGDKPAASSRCKMKKSSDWRGQSARCTVGNGTARGGCQAQ